MGNIIDESVWEENVTQFFRCNVCNKAYEMRERLHIKKKPFCFCGSKRFSPTRITLWETVKYLFFHPSVLIDTLRERGFKWTKQK